MGIFFDPEKLHVLAHKGEHFAVRGPLNVARPIQGWPVIVQAGASEAGRQIAAETAEVVFGSARTLPDAQSFYKDVKGRMARVGRVARPPEDPAGRAGLRRRHLRRPGPRRRSSTAWCIPTAASRILSMRLGVDASGFALDGPLPEIPETNASKSGRQNLDRPGSAREPHRRPAGPLVGAYGGLEMIGTPATIADQMQEWLEGEGCDGFNVMFPYVPGGLDDFVDLVVPELQRRGLFRREYEGVTLRENLGLPRPENRFFPKG